MNLFSAMLSERDDAVSAGLRARLQAFPLFQGVREGAMRRLIADSCWFGVPGGARLERDGEPALYFVVTGNLGVLADTGKGALELIAEVPAGEVAGEVSLLTDEHSAELVALRDCELLRVGERAFEALAVRHPKVVLAIMAVMARRLHRSVGRSSVAVQPKTFALVPLQAGLEMADKGRALCERLGALGKKAVLLDVAKAGETAEWFANVEAGHDIVLFCGDAPGTAWTHHGLRQADRVLYFARPDWPLPLLPQGSAKLRLCGEPDLVLVHPGAGLCLVSDFLLQRRGQFETVYHLRHNDQSDVERLARSIAGLAVALVLSGGGARGFAHIGVVTALKEAGVSFDFLGGVSMGAIVAAGLALEWDIDELTRRMRAGFVESNPLSDITIPLIALVRGRKVAKLLRTHFGQARIEDLPRPFFCISSDLTTGRVHVHGGGSLWRALRASASLPGIVPPVIARGHVLVDGGVMNNLPVDIMQKHRVGKLIASDVTGDVDFSVRDARYGEHSPWKLLWRRMRGTPSIVDILMRTGTLGSEAQRRMVRDEADLLFEPPLPELNPLDWKSFDRAVAEGYAHAAAIIEKRGVADFKYCPASSDWAAAPPPDNG